MGPSLGGGRGGIPSLAGAKVGNKSGRYLPVGNHVVDISAAKIVKSFNGGLYFAVEFTIVESDASGARPGDQYSWVRSFNDQYGYGPNDIKGWICTVVEAKHPGSNPAVNWEDAYISYIASEGDDASHDQPARGMRMHVHVWDKPNKTKSGSISIHDWRVLDDGETLGLTADASAETVRLAPPAQPQQFEPQTQQAAASGFGARPPGYPAALPWPPQAA